MSLKEIQKIQEQDQKLMNKKYIVSKNHINFIDCNRKRIFTNNSNNFLQLSDKEWEQFEKQWSNEKSDYITIWEKTLKESR
ncbi:hypothetical protein LT336_00745 [Spiroplasma sp. JKS002671]|nr:hypothetical protein [Spiroplasma sp. JKS002671]MCL8210993.1 hypothetical protein [Spiroplasma sp. JKS002671]